MDLIENANKNDDEKKTIQTQIDSEHSTTSSTATTATASSTPTTDTTVVTTRTQPFSFASSYTASVLQSADTSNLLRSASTAFTVLNNEEYFTVGGKPNAIVRPIPRNINLPQDASSDASAGKVAANKSTDAGSLSSVAHVNFLENRQNRLHFSEELNRKLRYLRNREALQATKTKSDNNESFLTKRPLFITTVPTGVFLPPAPLPILPTYKRHVYAYSSHPVIFTEAKYYNSSNENNNNNNNNNKVTNINHYSSSSSSKKNSSSSKDKLSMGRATIGLDDKSFVTHRKMSGAHVTTTTKTSINGMRLHVINNAPAPAAGLHISKQQFQQQIRESRNKR